MSGGSLSVLGHRIDAGEHPYTQRLISSVPVPDPVQQAERRLERAARTLGSAAS